MTLSCQGFSPLSLKGTANEYFCLKDRSWTPWDFLPLISKVPLQVATKEPLVKINVIRFGISFTVWNFPLKGLTKGKDILQFNGMNRYFLAKRRLVCKLTIDKSCFFFFYPLPFILWQDLFFFFILLLMLLYHSIQNIIILFPVPCNDYIIYCTPLYCTVVQYLQLAI